MLRQWFSSSDTEVIQRAWMLSGGQCEPRAALMRTPFAENPVLKGQCATCCSLVTLVTTTCGRTCSGCPQGTTQYVAPSSPPALQARSLSLLVPFTVPANLKPTALPSYWNLAGNGLVVSGSYIPDKTTPPLCFVSAFFSC